MIRAVLLIVKKDDMVIFVRRAKWRRSLPGAWSLPAEMVVRDEVLEEAAKRCAWNELGVKVEVEQIADELFSDEEKTLYFVRCKIIEGEPTLEFTDELDKLEYMGINEFFTRHEDSQIGHGLQYLRRHPELW
ncbi:MAG: NUDIX hydrolase [Candidatus Woesearchaeota archaeon]